MLYQPNRLLTATSILPIMTVEAGITVSQAAAMTGVPARTIRLWINEWPGLARREGRNWLIVDPDLLMDMAATRQETAGRLSVSGQIGAPRKPAESPPPPPAEYTMPAATAARLLCVSRERVYDWCRTVPEFARRAKGDRGEWRINPRTALAWGYIRIGKRQLPRWADPDEAKTDYERRAALLRQIWQAVRAKEPISDDLLNTIREELRKDRRKRTRPAASAAGEVRHAKR
jgi:hypothetical protein